MNVNEEYEVEILRENNEGDGVASVNGFIVFVKGALKNEKVPSKEKFSLLCSCESPARVL